MKTLTNKFDINVWNRGAYLETGHDEWVLCPVTILEDFSGYGYGKEMPELNLVLTSKEAEQLTLGWGLTLGVPGMQTMIFGSILTHSKRCMTYQKWWGYGLTLYPTSCKMRSV